MSKLEQLTAKFDRTKFANLHEELSMSEYLERVYQNPKIIRNAYQRLYDMIASMGTEKINRYHKTINKYKFFDDPSIEHPVRGNYEKLEDFVRVIKGAAGNYGPQNRILLLVGPVGSSKSTIVRRIKRAMEIYSRTDNGAWYTYKWRNLGDLYIQNEDECPMNEEPLKLFDVNTRKEILKDLNKIHLELYPEKERSDVYPLSIEGDVNPRCRFYLNELLKRYEGDLQKVFDEHITVVRKVYSESDRVGIGTFQPKDEKNQDATELSGDINFRNVGHFGKDSDPRAFNFDGEFQVANRGVCEFIEVLKLAKEFLYDLLGATQEHQIKPKKFSQVSIDEVIIGHTNIPEYDKLKSDDFMEALRDRTIKVDVPYLLEWSQERKVLEDTYNPKTVRQHIAPHTLSIASLFAITTRLSLTDEISLVDKAKVYDGQAVNGWNQDRIMELRKKHDGVEGISSGISARYIQDKIANCLSNNHSYVNVFMVLNEIESGLQHSSLVNKKHIDQYTNCLAEVRKEYNEILKGEVQRALVGDPDAAQRLCENYIDNIMASLHKQKIKNPFTGKEEEPNERLMRSIEEKIAVSDRMSDDFRQQIGLFIAAMTREGKQFRWDSNEKLRRALEKKLFEDTREYIKLSSLNTDTAGVVDPETQQRIDIIKKRLVDYHGYNNESAADVLNYVGQLFQQGDIIE